jgi:hypothetical protein
MPNPCPETFKRFAISHIPLASMLLYSDHSMQPEAPVNEMDTSVTGIEAAFSGRWGVWLSDTGHWWAARKQPLSARHLVAGCIPFVRAATPEELIEAIAEEERLMSQAEGGDGAS